MGNSVLIGWYKIYLLSFFFFAGVLLHARVPEKVRKKKRSMRVGAGRAKGCPLCLSACQKVPRLTFDGLHPSFLLLLMLKSKLIASQ